MMIDAEALREHVQKRLAQARIAGDHAADTRELALANGEISALRAVLEDIARGEDAVRRENEIRLQACAAIILEMERERAA